MTTEEAILIPTRAVPAGMSVTSKRRWDDYLHTISITEKSKWVRLSTGTILLGNPLKENSSS